MQKIYTFLLFLLCALSFARAQEPYAIHLNQASGLPSNSVYTVFQDSKGYIWFASDAGLTKYDGFEYHTFKCDAQTSTAGSCIKEDKYGRIWYENFDGYLYYVQNDSLRSLAQKNVLNYLPFGINNDFIIVVQKGGIDVYDLKSLKLIKTLLFEFNYVEYSTSIDDDFYFFANNRLYLIDRQFNTKICDFFAHTNEKVKGIYKCNGNLYILSKYNENKRLYIFDKHLNYKSSLAIQEPELIQGSSFIDSLYWIYTSKGVYSYGTDGRSRYYFSEKSISGVLKDHQNNYWFTTTNEGVFVVPSLNNRVHVFAGFLPNKIVKAQSGLLIGGKRGNLMQLDFGLKDRHDLVAMPEKSEIYYLYFDHTNNNIFYSSKGLSIVPKSNFNQIIHSPVSIKEIVKLDEKYYGFVASSFCGIILSPTAPTNLSSPWDSFYNKNPADNINNVVHFADNVRGKSLAYDSASHSIYYSGNIGFFKKTLNKHIEIKKDGQSFFASKIVLFNASIYALSTMGTLYKITNESKFENVNAQLGLGDFEVRLVRQFGDYIYFVSSRNVHSLNLQTGQYSTINLSIKPAEINDLFADSQSVYILNNEGLIAVPLKQKSLIVRNPKFYVNSIIAGNANFAPENALIFNHNQTEVNFRFSLLDFGNNATTSVYYKLNNEQWKLIPSETRTLSFLSLAYGTYSLAFRVNDQVQKDVFHFQIKAPFWQEWWFISLGVLLFLLAGYIYYRWRVSILSQQIVLLKEKVELEQSLGKSILTSIKSQMNPHFFYNALNTIQAYIFTNDKRNASLYLGKFSKLTRMILEMSEMESITLQEEVKALSLYLELEKMRFDDDFTFELIVAERIDVDMIKIPSMLIQPYAENAIKHGLLHRKGIKKLTIEISREEKYLKVIIDDNGIGRAKSAEMKQYKKDGHQSFSTHANEKRLEILNRNKANKVLVEIKDKVTEGNFATGTLVILLIPIE